MDNIPKEIIDKINDYRYGDKEYIKNKFNDVVNQLNKVQFFCKTQWTNNECNIWLKNTFIDGKSIVHK